MQSGSNIHAAAGIGTRVPENKSHDTVNHSAARLEYQRLRFAWTKHQPTLRSLWYSGPRNAPDQSPYGSLELWSMIRADFYLNRIVWHMRHFGNHSLCLMRGRQFSVTCSMSWWHRSFGMRIFSPASMKSESFGWPVPLTEVACSPL